MSSRIRVPADPRLALPELVAAQQRQRLAGRDDADPGVRRVDHRHEVERDQRQGQPGPGDVHELAQAVVEEGGLAAHQGAAAAEALPPGRMLHGPRRRLDPRDPELAREEVAGDAADAERHERDRVVDRHRHALQEDADDRDGDGHRQAHPRPAPAHQLEPAVRPGRTVHHDREEDRAHRRRDGGDRPDRHDDRDHRLVRRERHGQADQRVRHVRDQARRAVPLDGLAAALEELADRDRPG